MILWRYIFNSLPTRILNLRDDKFHFKVALWKYVLLILFIRLLNFICIEGMSLMAVIYKFNLYFVIYGLWFSYSSDVKLCYTFYILLCNLNCVILSCFFCTWVLYYCDLFHIWLSCNSFDLQNTCVICFIFCYVIWIVSFCVVLSVLVHYTTVTSFISNCPVTVLIYKMYALILNLRTRCRVPTEWEAVWSPQLDWTFWRQKSLAPAWI